MGIFSQLCIVRGVLQKTAPMLLQLNERAAAALRERDEQISERDQAVEEREQVRCLSFNWDAYCPATLFFYMSYKNDDG